MTKPVPDDAAAQRAIEGRDRADAGAKPADAPPSAGPHAESALVNPDATPGTGALPEAGEQGDADSTSS
jgi:hypothetical protein